MKRKTLRVKKLSKKFGIGGVVSIVLVIGCSYKMNESSQKEMMLYYRLEKIYDKYQEQKVSGKEVIEGSDIVKNFDHFLEEKFPGKEQQILEKFAKQDQDDLKSYQAYMIEGKEIDRKKPSLKNYFSKEEQRIFENSEEEIKKLIGY